MRSHPDLFRLTFLLPPGADARPGTHQPSADGCALTVRFPLAEITGPSRPAVFEHAARLLRVACRGLPPLSIGANLESPARPAARDAWSIIVGADVAFSPTGIDPELPRPAEPRPPPLVLHAGGRGG
jgi:hypothetical protein